jgi:hypothetical protein|tara:strand:- start:557 stop:841 length:285 start_codon:yes stop_codon:yes gene_type:complete
MKSVTITIGDYDLEIIEQIFEKESAFSPQDPRDELMIEVMRQVKDNPKVNLGADEEEEYKKAKTRFSKNLGADGKQVVSRDGQYLSPEEVGLSN